MGRDVKRKKTDSSIEKEGKKRKEKGAVTVMGKTDDMKTIGSKEKIKKNGLTKGLWLREKDSGGEKRRETR